VDQNSTLTALAAIPKPGTLLVSNIATVAPDFRQSGRIHDGDYEEIMNKASGFVANFAQGV
jgi:hypothetical protein